MKSTFTGSSAASRHNQCPIPIPIHLRNPPSCTTSSSSSNNIGRENTSKTANTSAQLPPSSGQNPPRSCRESGNPSNSVPTHSARKKLKSSCFVLFLFGHSKESSIDKSREGVLHRNTSRDTTKSVHAYLDWATTRRI